jgi:hypothetical protein
MEIKKERMKYRIAIIFEVVFLSAFTLLYGYVLNNSMKNDFENHPYIYTGCSIHFGYILYLLNKKIEKLL